MTHEDKSDAEAEKATFPQLAAEDAVNALPPARKRLFIFSVIAFAYVRSGIAIEFAQTATGKVGVEVVGGLYITGLSEEILLQGLGFIILFFFARYFWHEFMFFISNLATNKMFDGGFLRAFERGIGYAVLQPSEKFIDSEKTLTTPTHHPIGCFIILRGFVVWGIFCLYLPLTAMDATSTTAFFYAKTLLATLAGLFIIFLGYIVYVKYQTRKSKE